MSDTSQGPGWWQASDGKWYPPESNPSTAQSAAPPPPGPMTSVPGPPLAHQVGAVQLQRVVGKTRNPWGVWLLTLVTLGIYGLWWYYTINREMRDYNESILVQPGVAMIALLIPIAGLVSVVKCGGRIANAQRLSGSRENCSGMIGFLLAIVGFFSVYYQSQLNKVWDVYSNPPEGTPIAR